jgi:D-xylono/L-arabinono-1,4-lactonase
MNVTPELIADYGCITGEGPMWHPLEKAVYWVDISLGRMFRYDPATGKHGEIYKGEAIGGFTVQADGALLLFMTKGTVKIWRDGKFTTVVEDIPDERATRFNDVIADPAGRVFCGTMPTKERLGRLYRLDTDGALTKVLEDIGCSNGMGYTPDRKRMYYTDTTRHNIYLFDYDQASGAMTNQRVWVHTPEDAAEGHPDGMTVDAEGCVWGARWDGGCLVRYSPEGKELMRVQFPARKVSSVVFGGPDCTDMYVTTAGGNKKETEGAGAGALFRLNLGIRGVPEFYSRVKL